MKKLLLLCFLCVFVVSCSDDGDTDIEDDTTEMNDSTNDDTANDNSNNDGGSNDDNQNTGGDNTDNTTKLTYTQDIAPIISSNCFNCHGSPTRNGAPFSLTTYSAVNTRASSMDSRMNNASNPMPTSGLISQDLRDRFKQWIADGKLE